MSSGPTNRARSGHRQRSRPEVVMALAAVVGVAAALAPAAPTGQATIDLVERMVFAGVASYVAAHGRRAPHLWAAAVVAAGALDVALGLCLVALIAAVANLALPERNKVVAVLGTGATVNAVLWLPNGARGGWAMPLALLVVAAMVLAGRWHMRPSQRKRFDRALLGVGALILVAGALAAVGVLRAASSLSAGASSARSALEAVRNGNTVAARDHLDQSSEAIASGRSALGGWTAPARLVPGIAQQVEATTTAIDEADRITTAGDDIVATDYAELRYQGRVDLAEVERMLPAAHRVERVLATADRRLDEVDHPVLLPPLADRVEEFRDAVQTAHREVQDATTIADRLPSILGGEGERHYLVVLITPAELRGSGGFIGSWLDLQLVDGKATIFRSGRIADLIDYGRTPGTRRLDAPEDYVRRYGRFQPEFYVQDATLSPDWPSVAQALASIYPDAGGRPVDGVLSLDPEGLASLLELSGPVTVEGLDTPLDAANAVAVLTRDQYAEFSDRPERESVLADATRATFDALVAADLPSPRALGDVLGPASRGRHVKVWMTRPDDQALMRHLGVDGALALPNGGDGFEVVQQNVGNNKIDAYLQRSVAYDVNLDASTGSLRGTLTITLRNTLPSLDLPAVVVDNSRAAPIGSNVATVAVHTNLVVDDATIGGAPILLGNDHEAGLLTWDTPVLVVPAGESIDVVLQVHGTVDLRDGYRLRVLPQPVANPDELDISVHLTNGTFGSAARPDGLRLTTDDTRLRLTGTLDSVLDLRVQVSAD